MPDFSGIFFRFQSPWFLILFVFFPLLVSWIRKRTEPTVIMADLFAIRKIKKTWKVRFYPYKKWLIPLSMGLLILAMARPQKGKKSIEVITHGVDIVISMDTSGSMKAEDFRLGSKSVNRLEAIKSVAREFVKKRQSDRLGMVVFGSMAFTQCPLTLDHGVFLDFLSSLEIGMAGEQTAIGDAIGTAITRLKDLDSKSKILILLTDGANTAGTMEPLQAAEIAKTFGIKIYTIGIGTKGDVPMLVQTIFGPQYQYVRSDLDEELLKKISMQTGGKYFHGQNTEELARIYQEIDEMEKTKSKIKEHLEIRELFSLFAFLALFLLILDKFFDLVLFRRVP